ncbi:MAG: hypothetical protein IK108_01530 [Clostridia bacterium]|nr:hypothetical protein [Clostridia bacterium]
MIAVKTFLKKHKPFFCVFLSLTFYELIIVRGCSPWEISTVGYAFLALDYSFGFASFILPGQIFRLLCGDITQWKGSVFTAVIYLAVLIGVSALTERLLLSVKEEDRRELCGLLLFFLLGPCSFTVFFTQIGVIEAYWIPIVLLFFAAMKRPAAAAVLAVPLSLITLLVNWNAIVCVVPFFCILLLYQLSLETKKTAKVLLGVGFLLCVALSIVLAGYLMVCVPGNMRYSLDEFHAVMLDKGVTFFHYVDSWLYRVTDRFMNPYFESIDVYELQKQGFWVYFPEIFKGFFSVVADQFSTRNPLRNLGPFIAAVPILLLLEGFFLRRVRDKRICLLRRFSYFCMGAMFFVTLLITTLFSFDYIKWLSYSLLLLFSSFLFVLSRERDAALGYLKKVFARIPLPVIVVYFIAYASVVLDIYY